MSSLSAPTNIFYPSPTFTQKGLDFVREGRYAVVILGGGHASRYGGIASKGLLTVHGRYLFAWHAERLMKAQTMAGQRVRVPLYIMVSPGPSEQATKDFFAAYTARYPNVLEVTIFVQNVIPVHLSNGTTLHNEQGDPIIAPNGHGGVYESLRESGILEEMRKKGIEAFTINTIDNALLCPVDFSYIGACVENRADFANKTVSKRDPSEPVGIVAMREGAHVYVGYSELSDTERSRDDLQEGCILNCFCTVDLAERVHGLPEHISNRVVPLFDESLLVQKREMYAADARTQATNPIIFHVDRDSHFAPIKNRSGPDSLESAHKIVGALHRDWLSEWGVIIEGDAQVIIPPSVSYMGELPTDSPLTWP